MKTIAKLIGIGMMLLLVLPSNTIPQQIQKNNAHGYAQSSFTAGGKKITAENIREFQSALTHRHEFPAIKDQTIDSLLLKILGRSFSDDRQKPNRHQNKFLRGDKIFSRAGQISVVDTAIFIDYYDTTRDVYTYNGIGKMILDIAQKRKDTAWVNFSRATQSYDTRGNTLGWSVQYWNNGQWENYDRSTSPYDANGNPLTWLFELWRNNQWETYFKFTYTFDVNGNLLTELLQRGPADSGYYYRYTYTYDSRGNQLSDLYEYYWYGVWENDLRLTWTYDAGGNMLSRMEQDWLNDQWEYNDHYIYTYDVNGNLLSNLYEQWLPGQWVYRRRVTYTYDANRKMLSKLNELWNSGWVNSFQSIYINDGNGNMISELEQRWVNGEWVNATRSTYSYNGDGKKLTFLYEFASDGQWTNYECDTYTYNANGNLLSELDDLWLNNQWMNSNRALNVYDINGNITSLLHQVWTGTRWAPCCDDFYIEDGAGNYFYYYAYKIDFIRRTIVTGVTAQLKTVPFTYSLSQNYPNPFNPSTIINYQLPNESYVRLSLFNVLGQEVRTLVNRTEQPGEKSVQVDASGLPSGIYFYRIDATSVSDPTKHFSQTRKMLLIK
ncbi:MAG: T9SS type A sorting domain-containing protein [Bacteroidota bacterium]